MEMKFEDIIYTKKDNVAKIAINRPQMLNAIRKQTGRELVAAFEDAAVDRDIGVIVFTGVGKAFCVGGDATEAEPGKAGYEPETLGMAPKVHHFIRNAPKPVIAAVNGYAIGGGQVFHLLCDLSIASEDAIFGQVGPRVGSFDAGFGAAYLVEVVGQKKAREIWYLCRRYTAKEAMEMGLVNKVVPAEKLDEEVDAWCREILDKSPTALKFLKASFNAYSDSIYGLEALAYRGLELYYETEEAAEGRQAFLEKRPTKYKSFKR